MIKIISCKCIQCKFVKNKRKNRKSKKMIKRWLNKKRRTGNEDKIINFYWA